jgi:hypothetical protein
MESRSSLPGHGGQARRFFLPTQVKTQKHPAIRAGVSAHLFWGPTSTRLGGQRLLDGSLTLRDGNVNNL